MAIDPPAAQDRRPSPEPGPGDPAPAPRGGPGRAWAPMALGLVAAVVIAAVATLSAGLGRSPDADAASPRPAAVVEPISSSGPIGPWQRLGHAHSTAVITARAAADRRGVLLLGDSSAARVRSALAVELTAQARPLAWDHWNGRPTHATVDALVALDSEGRQPMSLAVVSGSNDVFEPALFAVQVERLMRTAGPERQVYWVLPDVARAETAAADQANSRRVVGDLRAAAARHPNLHLLDWPAHLAGLDDAGRAHLVPDGVHPSPAGSRVIAGLLAAALA